jgi:4-amino-4-deoxy-L-arabinose transferase-like glycosyltransferase
MLFFFRLGDDLPLRSHEALLAETARNMALERPVQLSDGSRPSPWLVPNWNGTPRLRKTPLGYWLVAGLSRAAGGMDEWVARLPSAAAALGTVLVVMALLARQEGRATALLGGLALATMVQFCILARSALADMAMTFAATAALAALWMAAETAGGRRLGWFLAAGAAAGLAMLAKGPVPLVILPAPWLVAAVAVVWRLGRRPDRLPHGEWAWTIFGAAGGAVLFLAITLPWPVYVYLRVPDALAIWRAESVDRAAGEFGHSEPAWFYLVRLPLLVLPWTVFFAWGLVLAGWRARHEAAHRPWLALVGAWLVGPLLGFSLASGKQDHYILPILPAAAVCAAMAMRRLLVPAPGQGSRVGRVVLAAHAVAAILLGLGGLAAYVLGRSYAGLVAPLGLEESVAALVLGPGAVIGGLSVAGGVAALVLARRGRLVAGLAALAAALSAVFLYAGVSLIGPMNRATTAAEFARRARQKVPADAPLLALDGADSTTMVYYLDRAVPSVPGAEVRRRAASGEAFYLVCFDKSGGETAAAICAGTRLVPILAVPNRYRPKECFHLLRAAAPPGGG